MSTVVHRRLGHKLEAVTPGLWRLCFHLPASTNCWFWQEPDGLTLIDAANCWNASTIYDTTRFLDLPLRRIVITHAHPDHAGSAAELARLTGAQVSAHQIEVPFLTGQQSIADQPASRESRYLHRAARNIGILHPPAMANVNALSDGDYIGSLKVLHTPGHTPGSISLWSESDGALFIGDNASTRLGFLLLNRSWFTLNSRLLDQSLQKYSEVRARMLLSGHGSVYRSRDVVADLQNLGIRVLRERPQTL